MKRNYFKLILFSILLFSNLIFGQSHLNWNDNAFVDDKNEWMICQKEDRIYIKKECLCLTEKGIFLKVNEIFFPIQNLSVDENGFFI